MRMEGGAARHAVLGTWHREPARRQVGKTAGCWMAGGTAEVRRVRRATAAAIMYVHAGTQMNACTRTHMHAWLQCVRRHERILQLPACRLAASPTPAHQQRPTKAGPPRYARPPRLGIRDYILQRLRAPAGGGEAGMGPLDWQHLGPA